MAAADALSTCPKCKQTIFAGAPKCQFCGVTLGDSGPAKSFSGVTYADESGNAEGILKACSAFWIVWNCLVLIGIIKAKLAENAGAGPHVQNNILGLPIGLITAISLIACCIGMMGKNPGSLRKGVFVSVIGSIALTPTALWVGYYALSTDPRFFLYAAFSLVGAIATFATRWSAKRV